MRFSEDNDYYRSDCRCESCRGGGNITVEVVVGAVDCILEIEHLAEYHEVEDAEGKPSEEYGEDVGGDLKALRTAVDGEICVATRDPHAIPYYGVDTQGDNREHDEEEQPGSMSTVIATCNIGFLGKGIDQVPLVKA